MLRPALVAEFEWTKRWLVETALPFWGSRGFDTRAKLFEERFDLLGEPITGLPHRLMVQCRQIYVFAHATLLGWYDGHDLVEQGFKTLVTQYADRTADCGYVFSILRDGAVSDPRQDTYAFAFVLFTFAWTRRLLGKVVDEGMVASLITHIERRLLHTSGSGFVDGAPRPDLRLRQNPQMHLMEAALYAEAAFGSDDARRLADRLYDLFHNRLFVGPQDALPEIFDDDWHVADPDKAAFEPGHHFEWIWLLDRYGLQRGIDVDDLIRRLGRRAAAEGIDTDGVVIEAVGICDGTRVASRRCWATCEGLKAAMAAVRKGQSSDPLFESAAGFLRALRVQFLASPFPAGWVDRVDAHGRSLVSFVPASSLYHVFLAIAETDAVLMKTAPVL